MLKRHREGQYVLTLMSKSICPVVTPSSLTLLSLAVLPSGPHNMFQTQSSRSRRAAKRRKTSVTLGFPTTTEMSSSDGAAYVTTNADATLATSHTNSSMPNDSSGDQASDHTAAPTASTSGHGPASTFTAEGSPPTEEPSSSSWPAKRIPVEIFNLIIQYVPRKAVQTMRLVNREFDAKLAEIYFNVVVVPFRPEFEALYGSLNINPGSSSEKQKLSLVIGKTTDETGSTDGTSQSSANDGVLSAGHRVFEQFGDKMRKFALALELNEKDLASPPLKINQEILLAPWGLYRWPIMNYQRYSRVEGLEQMANETGYMMQAFQYLKYVAEIGISCDAGLGWLCGPDTNPFCTRTQPPVFRPMVYEGGGAGSSASAEEEGEESLSLSILKQMALNAGYSEVEWPRVILRLLEDEGREGVIEWIERILPSGRLIRDRIPYLEVNESTTKEDIIFQIKNAIVCDGELTVVGTAETTRSCGLVPCNLSMAQAEMLLELEWAHRALMQSYRIAVMDNKNSFQNLKQLNIARCPSCRITTWCDDEFWETMTSIETFHLGVIPDWREITKDSSGAIDQRRVAPSDASRNVFKLLQFYVAEQKNIKNISFEWVCGGEFAMGKSQRDRYILPAPVLSDIGNMVNIPYEFRPDDILNLPFISKLSLKNCWFTPHVFLFFFQHMFLEALREVTLESVSLTGPPTSTPELSIYPGPQYKPAHWPWPLCVGAEPGSWFQLQRPNNNIPAPIWHGGPAVPVHFMPMHANVPAAQVQPGVMPPAGAFNPGNMGFIIPPNQAAPGAGAMATMQAALQAAPPLGGPNHAAAIPINHLTAPAQQNMSMYPHRWRAWSWPHVLACLGMAPNAIAQHLVASSVADKMHETSLRNNEKRFAAKFKSILEDRVDHKNHQVLSFKSCGYALVDTPGIDNWKIIPDHAIPVQQSAEFINRLKDLDNQMLTTQDAMLAKIINYMPDEEERQLRTLFGFQLGWDNLYDPVVRQAAIADGNPSPGQARFFGKVENEAKSVGEKEKLESKGEVVGLHRS